MKKLLVVTGSRSLLRDGVSEQWGYTRVLERVGVLTPGEDLVVTGDASGPDAWAAFAAVEAGVTCFRYELSGVLAELRDGARFERRWAPGRMASNRAWPLVRNDRMIADVASRQDAYEVLVLGLRCPWAKTHGTEYTLRIAREAGLATSECLFPVGAGPTPQSVSM